MERPNDSRTDINWQPPAKPQRYQQKQKRRKAKGGDWAERSRLLRQIVGHCVVCYSKDRLVAHHMVYARPQERRCPSCSHTWKDKKRQTRGSDLELPEDIVVICADCHDSLHRLGFSGRQGFYKFRAWRESRADFVAVQELADMESDLEPSWVFD